MIKNVVEAEDIKEMVIALKEVYPYNLKDVDVERILFWRDISDKKPTKAGKYTFAYVKKVDDLDKKVNPNIDFHFVVNASFFDKKSPAQQHIIVFHECLHIGENEIDDNGEIKSKIVPHDIEEHYLVLATWGLDYMTNDTVADPLAEKVELKFKPVDRDIIPEELPNDSTEPHSFV